MHGSPVCWEFTCHFHGCKPPGKLPWQLCNHHFSEWGRKEVRCSQNTIWRVTAWHSRTFPYAAKQHRLQQTRNRESLCGQLWGTRHTVGNSNTGCSSRTRGLNHSCPKPMKSQTPDQVATQSLQYLSWIFVMPLLFSYTFLPPNNKSIN